ncbi:MAG: hypothetical protein RR573_09580 [Oscillospiraceae bacterium]
MENLILFLEDTPMWIITAFVSAITFILGIVFKELIVDKFFNLLNKNRCKQKIEESILPQIYTQPIKSEKDYEELNKRLENCSCLIMGKFAVKDVGGLQITSFETSIFQKSNIFPLTTNWRFIQIENPSAYTCFVLAINQLKKESIKIVSSQLTCIKSNEIIGIFVDEYKKPENVIINFNGNSIKYIISENRNNSKGIVL